MGMLKEMDIFVRSHLTPLKEEQVSLMRARWEREKRRLKEPPAPASKRRRAVKVEAVPVVEDARPKRRRLHLRLGLRHGHLGRGAAAPLGPPHRGRGGRG